MNVGIYFNALTVSVSTLQHCEFMGAVTSFATFLILWGTTGNGQNLEHIHTSFMDKKLF